MYYHGYKVDGTSSHAHQQRMSNISGTKACGGSGRAGRQTAAQSITSTHSRQVTKMCSSSSAHNLSRITCGETELQATSLSPLSHSVLAAPEAPAIYPQVRMGQPTFSL